MPQRSFGLPDATTNYDGASGWNDTRTQIAPNARFGVGMFGWKSERSHQNPVTVREVGAPRTRRAGVGFSFKF